MKVNSSDVIKQSQESGSEAVEPAEGKFNDYDVTHVDQNPAVDMEADIAMFGSSDTAIQLKDKILGNLGDNLVLGENHSDSVTRDTLRNLLVTLKSSGYKYICYELENVPNIGDLFFDPEQMPSSYEQALAGLSLEEVTHFAAETKNEVLLGVIKEYMNTALYSHSGKGLGDLIEAAIRSDFDVVFLDYDKSNSKAGKKHKKREEKAGGRVPYYDHFAAERLKKLDGLWVAISGDDHVKGISEKTNSHSIQYMTQYTKKLSDYTVKGS